MCALLCDVFGLYGTCPYGMMARMRDTHMILHELRCRLNPRYETEHGAGLLSDREETVLAAFADVLLDEFQDRLNERLENARL